MICINILIYLKKNMIYDEAKNVQWIDLWETVRETLILSPK
jgi:hypothetical protein